MAQIITYPKLSTLANNDLLLISDVSSANKTTNSVELQTLANFITTSTNVITGSGTLNTIAMFTPDGQTIGDSIITQAALGQGVTVNGVLDVTDDFDVAGSIQCNQGLTVEGISTFNDDATFSTVQFQAAVKDTNSDLGTDGQLLVSNTQGYVEWKDPEEVVSGAIAKLIPTIIVASAGGSSTYSGDNNIVELRWTGGNGTYTLNVPSATAIPYRVIRFVTDGTFPGGASHKINITAQAGETIDGNPNFEISKVYEGVSMWSTGTEWIVIQAKAH